jgi:PHD finger protein 20
MHFKSQNFTLLQSGKIILKSFTVPSVFPWNKDSVVITKSVTSIVTTSSDIESSDKKKKTSSGEKDSKEEVKVKLEEVEIEESPVKSDSKKKSSTKVKKEEPLLPKQKSSKRLSAKFAAAASSSAKKIKKEAEVVVVEKPKSKVPESPVTKKKDLVTNFIPGSTIEAQNFDGKWIQVKVIEVDMDEREVLVRSNEKSNKSKAGINDEWISMESPRLRPAQPAVTFDVGEKVLARWNDCRKFPATIQRVLENDTYDVLFDDGYPKIVRGVHINKFSPSKNQSKAITTEAPLPVINPLLLNPPSLIPEYVKQMIKDKKVPDAPTEGEWCCAWVDDIPVGEESTFDGTHGKCPSIIVPDWRVKEGWQKHIYLRQNGKWDVLFISPTGRKIRFKNELKLYLTEIGEVYDPETWDYSLQKKRSKAKNLCIQSEQLKQQQVLPQNFEVKTENNSDGAPIYSNPFANLGALPYVQPNLVQSALSTQSEVSVGSLKVKVINNVFFCPAEGCDKQFRKENHLQLHIKHYHGDLAKLMGECPNMEDLAYLRTTGTIEEAEVSIVKNPPRKSQPVKSTPTSSTPRPSKDLSESINSEASPSSRFNLQRSPILEEALKAPLVTCQPIKDFVIKLEPLSQAALAQFDPETLIPPHAVSRIQHQHHPVKGHHKRRIKLRFNPKSKKPFKKKIIHNVGSTVEGVIPYNEGPYLKNQVPPGNYVDENGEVIKIVRMKKEEIINCICGFGEEDGLMIQCDICLCWQHGWCHGIENSHQVPEKYICTICKNPYRQRASMRWTHDQDWLYDGKLPIASYHAPNPRQLKRVDTLKNCHTLIGNLMEMKKFMKSLDVKINIAENSEHPKLYLWSKKWEESPPRDVEMKDESKIKKEDLIMQPIAPEPEAAIEPAKCRQSLLDHIQNQQHCVKSRLDNIEMEIECKFNIKHLEKCKINHKFFLQPSKSKQLRTATPNSQSMKEL